MSTFGARLKEERKRTGLNQTDFAAAGGVQKGAQVSYEQDERLPGAEYLILLRTIGVDVLYVLTGEITAANLSKDEFDLVEGFRGLDIRGKTGVLSLISGIQPEASKNKNVFKGSVGQIVEGNNTAPVTFNFGLKKKE